MLDTLVPSAARAHEEHRHAPGSRRTQGRLLAELGSRGLPGGAVQVLPWDEENRELRHAVRVRLHPAKAPCVDVGFAVRLVLDGPVHGPLTLGYGVLGLGLFVTAE